MFLLKYIYKFGTNMKARFNILSKNITSSVSDFISIVAVCNWYAMHKQQHKAFKSTFNYS